jgi:ubiquinol-cytochrome c reductase cytochrome c subunit
MKFSGSPLLRTGCVLVMCALVSVLITAGLITLLVPRPALGAALRAGSQPVGQQLAAANAAGIYTENCTPCHGADGQGSDNGPSLKAAGFAELVAPKVRVGEGGMPVFAGILTDQQIESVSDYVVQTLADPATHEASQGEGGVVFRLYCATCHGSTGRGGALTGGHNAPILGEVIGADALVDMIEGPAEMPVFAGTTLTNRQQAAVALYMQDVIAQLPSPGGYGMGDRGPVTEGFFALVLGLGSLVLLARWAQGARSDAANV